MEKINVALAGHTSVGKTLFCDTALYDIGAADSIGKVDEGKSLSDYDEEEIKRKISIHSTIFSAEVNGRMLNIVDTPGRCRFQLQAAAAVPLGFLPPAPAACKHAGRTGHNGQVRMSAATTVRV